MEDEERPRPRQDFEQRPLGTLSVEDLAAYREALQAEIGRVEVAIAAKRGHRDAADAVFRRS